MCAGDTEPGLASIAQADGAMNTETLNLTTDMDIPDWVNWLAQDANGIWWGYEVEPLTCHNGFYENEVGRSLRIHQDVPNPDWASTLIRYRRASSVDGSSRGMIRND